MSKGAVYTKYDSEMPAKVLSLLQTIRIETWPVTGHSDPGAIQDCWNTVEEMVGLMATRLKKIDQPKTYAQKLGETVTKILETDYPNARPFISHHTEEQVLYDFECEQRTMFSWESGEAEQIFIGQY